MQRTKKRQPTLLGRLLGDTRGVSAVEFSLLAPVLIFGTFATVDAGMAVYESMMMGQVLRTGAQSAIDTANQTTVLSVMEQVAAQNFTMASGGTTPEVTLNVQAFCSCPGALATPVSCASTCTGGVPANEFFDMTASKTFDGVILPAFTLNSSLAVMVQ